MFQTLSKAVFALAIVLVPAQLLAGGPAWLCVPIDGLTPANQERCTSLLGDALEGSLFTFDNGQPAIKIERHEDQWYATFHLKNDVRLSEMERAFKGSPFSIPRDRLRLFGHVILEIQSSPTAVENVKDQLDALEYIAVSEVKPGGSLTEITIDMPYPTRMSRQSDGTRFWEDAYQWNDLNTFTAPKNPPTTSQALPGPKDLSKLLARHDAELKDLRWSPVFHCRAIGCVAIPKAPETTKAK